MTIYTITFCNTTNVGAALQEYALQQYLTSQGHQVKVVNYVPEVMERLQSVWSPLLQSRGIKKIGKNLLLLPLKIKRRKKYNDFSRKYIMLTKKCHTTRDITALPQPDIYVVGSDQVWNDEIVEWAPGYFLNFPTEARKWSYAASAGKDSFADEFVNTLKRFVAPFEKISVREEQLKNLLVRNGIGDVRWVLDPVFLLSKNDYQVIMKQPKQSGYILLYEAEINEQCIEVARKLANEKQLKIVQINRINNRYHVDQVISCVSPTEFLGLVNNAEYIISNSFHAVAMSIILEKQFWTIRLHERASRIESVLKAAGLEERIVNENILDCSKKIDYERVNENLKDKIDESKQFLNM